MRKGQQSHIKHSMTPKNILSVLKTVRKLVPVKTRFTSEKTALKNKDLIYHLLANQLKFATNHKIQTQETFETG